MIANLDAISDKPASLAAVGAAMHARPQVAAMAVTQKDESIRSMVGALVAECLKNERARAAFLAALQENSPQMAQILATNPATMARLMGALAEVGVSTGKEELRAAVKAMAPGD